MQDMVASTIQLSMFPVTVALPQVRAGHVRAYAITAPKRSAAAPDIPTVDEAGLPGFYVSVWNGLWVPKGTAPDVIARLNGAAVKAMATPGLQKRFADLGQDQPEASQKSPAALAALQKAEISKWWPILKAANVKTN
jgi:tripartite-type tricarboxylate transporter receptor subunit TctC